MRKLFAVVKIYEEKENGDYELYSDFRIEPNSILDSNTEGYVPISHHYFNFAITTYDGGSVL